MVNSYSLQSCRIRITTIMRAQSFMLVNYLPCPTGEMDKRNQRDAPQSKILSLFRPSFVKRRFCPSATFCTTHAWCPPAAMIVPLLYNWLTNLASSGRARHKRITLKAMPTVTFEVPHPMLKFIGQHTAVLGESWHFSNIGQLVAAAPSWLPVYGGM